MAVCSKKIYISLKRANSTFHSFNGIMETRGSILAVGLTIKIKRSDGIVRLFLYFNYDRLP